MNSPKRRSHRMVVVLLILLLLGVLADCGPTTPGAGPSPSGPTPTVTVPADMPVTVALAGRFPGQTLAALDEQIAAFETANPDARIEVVRAPRDAASRREWLAARLAERDTSIDVFLLDATWPADFAANGGLVPLDDRLLLKGIDASALLPAAVEANTLDGHLVALPWSADGGVLYYRRDLLEKYGYSPPSTWSDLQRIALDVSAEEELPHGFVWQGAAGENLTCSTLEFVWDYGGDVFDEAGNVIFDSRESQAALQRMTHLVTSGASPLDVAAYDDLTALTAFRNGDAVFLRNWFIAWDYLNSQDSPVANRIGVAALPASCLGGQSLGLSVHSLYPDKALRFMAFLVGYDQQVEMALAANQPPALEAVYHDAELLAQAPVWRTLRNTLPLARARPSVAGYADLSKAIYTEVNRMLAGYQDAETTTRSIQDRIESRLR